jgi:cysteine synthase
VTVNQKGLSMLCAVPEKVDQQHNTMIQMLCAVPEKVDQQHNTMSQMQRLRRDGNNGYALPEVQQQATNERYLEY